jgi:hypothetical protein
LSAGFSSSSTSSEQIPLASAAASHTAVPRLRRATPRRAAPGPAASDATCDEGEVSHSRAVVRSARRPPTAPAVDCGWARRGPLAGSLGAGLRCRLVVRIRLEPGDRPLGTRVACATRAGGVDPVGRALAVRRSTLGRARFAGRAAARRHTGHTRRRTSRREEAGPISQIAPDAPRAAMSAQRMGAARTRSQRAS